MKLKRIIMLIVISFLICIAITLFAFRVKPDADIDLVAINDIEQSLVANWENLEQREAFSQWQILEATEFPGLEYGFDFVVLDKEEDLIAATRRGLNEQISSALRNRDTIINIKRENEDLGTLIIYNDAHNQLERYRKDLLSFVILLLAAVAMLCIGFTLYYDRTIFRPFRKLQSFARHVAGGNLNMPLEMDQGNLFGAFTESFDLMRDEINKARQNESKANQSKKELVASLSHDIKTPIASIKAVSELMYAKSSDEAIRKQVEIIDSKADQINTLITNLFNATLEELQELKVVASEQSSLLLFDLIKKADYNNLITIRRIEECLIMTDELRLAQVIDNVISNSYKYAGTSIEVSSQMKGEYLEVVFKDFGLGVPEDEKALIFHKFYRAKNAINKSGTGLGLYISKFIMNQMCGDIACENTGDGFAVILKLKIV